MDGEWLALQLATSRRTQAELARFLGLQPPQINKMVKGRRRILSGEADQIREFFKLPRETQAFPQPTETEAGDMRQSVVDARAIPPLPFEMSRDVPIFGTVGGAGALTMEATDWARRPPRLQGRGDIFGLYVEDSTMVPAYKPGALIFVERSKPPAIGDDVVVELADAPGTEPRAVIKTLLALSPTEIRLQQHNPPQEILVSRMCVVRMLRVMTLADLLGV